MEEKIENKFYIDHIKKLIDNKRYESVRHLLLELKKAPEYEQLKEEAFNFSEILSNDALRTKDGIEQCLKFLKTEILDNNFAVCEGKNSSNESFIYFPFYTISWYAVHTDMVTGSNSHEDRIKMQNDLIEEIQNVFGRDKNIKNNYKFYLSELKRHQAECLVSKIPAIKALINSLDASYLNAGLGEKGLSKAPKL